MQQMYEDYKDIVEFRLVYMSEAHAADGSWPVAYAKDLGITEHKDYGQRCETAERLLKDKSLTTPTLIDGMDNEVNEAYKAHPDRIFVVRKDGRLAVAAARGPFGFTPALKETQQWLADYKKSGQELPLPEPSEGSQKDMGEKP